MKVGDTPRGEFGCQGLHQLQIDPAVGVKIATLVAGELELPVNIHKVGLLPFETKLVDGHHLIAQVQAYRAGIAHGKALQFAIESGDIHFRVQ